MPSPSTSTPHFHRLKWMVCGVFIAFCLTLTLTLLAYHKRPHAQEDAISYSYDGTIYTLPQGHPNATRNQHRNTRVDTLQRLASFTLPFLLHPRATQRLFLPLPNTPQLPKVAPSCSAPACAEHSPVAPLESAVGRVTEGPHLLRQARSCSAPACAGYPPITPTIPPVPPSEHPLLEAYDTIWIETPPRFDPTHPRFFSDDNLLRYANALRPNGLLVIDIDGRETRACDLQGTLQRLHPHFPFLQLWQMGFTRWQIISSKRPLTLHPTTIDAFATTFPTLAYHLHCQGIVEPWALFAACLHKDATTLLNATFDPEAPIESLAPTTYQTSIDTLFTTPPPPTLQRYRNDRQRFMQHDFSAHPPSSDPYLLTYIHRLLLDDHLLTPQLTLNTLHTLLPSIHPTLDHLAHLLEAAQRCHDHTTIDRTLHILQQRLPHDPQAADVRLLLFSTLLALDRKAEAQALAADFRHQATDPQQRRFFHLEHAFLAAERSPTPETLLALHHTLLALPPSTQLTLIQRYTTLLTHTGYAREAIQLMRTFGQHGQLPPSLLHPNNQDPLHDTP